MMSCQNGWVQIAKPGAEQAFVPGAGVVGVAQCIQVGCEAPINLATGRCVDGHVQEPTVVLGQTIQAVLDWHKGFEVFGLELEEVLPGPVDWEGVLSDLHLASRQGVSAEDMTRALQRWDQAFDAWFISADDDVVEETELWGGPFPYKRVGEVLLALERRPQEGYSLPALATALLCLVDENLEMDDGAPDMWVTLARHAAQRAQGHELYPGIGEVEQARALVEGWPGEEEDDPNAWGAVAVRLLLEVADAQVVGPAREEWEGDPRVQVARQFFEEEDGLPAERGAIPALLGWIEDHSSEAEYWPEEVVDPEVVGVFDGSGEKPITVYHAYGDGGYAMEYGYRVETAEGYRDFDIRDLASKLGMRAGDTDGDHRKVLRRAISTAGRVLRQKIVSSSVSQVQDDTGRQ